MGATPLMKKTVDFKGFYGTPGSFSIELLRTSNLTLI